MTNPFVSIVILNHNGLSLNPDALLACVNSALSVSIPREVVFVDNGSTDGSLKAVRSLFGEQLKYVVLGCNKGYSAGMNAGFQNASPTSKYLLFTNNDVVFDADAVHALVRLLEEDSRIGVASCNMVVPKTDYLKEPDYVRGGSFLDLLLVHHYPRSKGGTRPFPVTMVENFLVVRREVFEAVGGFDPEFFFGFDEAMLCLKAWFAGSSVVCHPKHLVRHVHRPPKASSKGYRITRNKYLIMLELYDGRFLAATLLYKLAADVFYSMASPLWRKRRAIKNVAAGIADILVNLKHYYLKRLCYKKIKLVSQAKLVEQGVFVKRPGRKL